MKKLLMLMFVFLFSISFISCKEKNKEKEELNKIKPVWIELGLQTIHDKTAKFIRRGYKLSVFDEAVENLNKRGIKVIVHIIIGLPSETKKMIFETIDYLSTKNIFGIKLQLLHVIKNTDMALIWENHIFETLTLEEYADILIGCIERLPKNIVIHRITGDSPPQLLLSPEWSRYKWTVLNFIHSEMKKRNSYQGKFFDNISK